MTHRLKIIVNGKPYLVEVEDLQATPLQVRVNGQAYVVEVEEPLAISHQPATPRHPTAQPTRRPTNAITAPMPGNIIRISVKPGDQVRVGQTLCYLEAMKMQNAIRSPRDGVIASVNVQSGQAVNHGDILFLFR